MFNIKFIVGEQYIYGGLSEPLTYLGASKRLGVGVFKSDSGSLYHFEYTNMAACKQTHPNPPLPHFEERIKRVEQCIEDHEHFISKYKEELAELKATLHY